MNLSLEDARALVTSALEAAGASSLMAASTARALVLAESQGQGGHGLSRVGQYATHLRNGRVNGSAQATVVRRKGGALLIDAGELVVVERADGGGEHAVGPGDARVLADDVPVHLLRRGLDAGVDDEAHVDLVARAEVDLQPHAQAPRAKPK